MRTIDNVIETINKQTRSNQKKRYTRNLAESLSLIARIPEGKQLVCIFGKGDESNNIEALSTWINNELKICTLDQCSHLDYLYARFLQVFDEHNLIY